MEYIQSMIKLVRQEVEKAKGSVRNVRHKALEAVKKEFRSADERRRTEREVGWTFKPLPAAPDKVMPNVHL